jgi:hypothetical protein
MAEIWPNAVAADIIWPNGALFKETGGSGRGAN